MNAQSSASIQVAASVRKTERLRQEAVEYRRLSAAAVKGSQEQIAAANLATRAESRLAAESQRLRGNASNLDKDIGRASRGALAGSGVFRGLGRSIAFASGGFLAFASAGQFIRTSIDAAKEAQVTQKQLGQQLKNNGQDLADYQAAIDKTNLHLSALSGFTKDELDVSLTTILRSTNDVSKALRDNATAADLARARHIGLAQAAFVIAKVEAGNTTLLRRQGFQIAKNATAEQALAVVRARIAGQAKAGSTEQERFGAVLHDTEVIIGTGILPTLNKYLVSGAAWLTQMNESGKLQKDVNTIVGDTTAVIKDVTAAIREASDAVGGFKNLIELLIGLKIASVVGGWAASLTRFRVASVAAGGSATGLGASLGNAGLAAQAGVASFAITTLALKVTGLDADLKAAGATAADFASKLNFGGVVGVAPTGGPVVSQQQAARILTRSRNDFAKGIDTGHVVADIQKQFPKLDPQQIGILVTYAQKQTSQSGSAADAAAKANAGLARKAPQVAAAAAGAGATPAQLDRLSQIQNQVAAARLAVARGDAGAKAQLVAALKAEIDFDKKYAAIQQRLYKQGGVNAKQHADAYQRLVADETSAFSEIDSLTKKDSSAAKKAGTAAKKAWTDRLKQLQANVVSASATPGTADDITALKAEIAAIQKRIRDVGKTGELEMQLARVKKQLATAISKQGVTTFAEPFSLLLAQAKAGATASTTDDIKVAREMKAFAEKMIKSGKLKGQALIDAWNEIAAANATIGQDAAGQAHAVAVSAESLVKGVVGLTLAQKKELEQRYAQAGAHGGHRPTGHGVLGQDSTIVVHTHVNLDGKKVAENTTQHQQRAGRHKAHQVRGPYAGRH